MAAGCSAQVAAYSRFHCMHMTQCLYYVYSSAEPLLQVVLMQEDSLDLMLMATVQIFLCSESPVVLPHSVPDIQINVQSLKLHKILQYLVSNLYL